MECNTARTIYGKQVAVNGTVTVLSFRVFIKITSANL